MAVTPVVRNMGTYEVAVWASETGTGVKAHVADFADLTVQASGTGTVTFQGSNDGTNFVNLKDIISGTDMSLAAASNGAGVPVESPIWVRPVVAGGTATVTVIAKGNR